MKIFIVSGGYEGILLGAFSTREKALDYENKRKHDWVRTWVSVLILDEEFFPEDGPTWI